MRELTLDEMEVVDGGVAPIIVAAAVVGGSFVAGVAVGFALVAIAEAIW